MCFRTLINWTVPFPILGLLGGIFSFFIQILKETVCKQWRTDQTPHLVASDLVLHCLPMSDQKDASLIWVNRECNNF